MTIVSGEWLSKGATQTVAETIENAGHQVFFVGGCVRNSLMDVAVSDIDMATDARPDVMVKLFEKAELKTIPTGIDHGTITVISAGIAHEITTFRKDVKTDGRHADVAFSLSMNDDALRRDFTMNALYADRSGKLFDPVNGLPDLQAHRVRFVGDPDERIAEDYLRILRFFRFHAWYGDPDGGIDADGLAACASGIDGLDQLSNERIGTEMIKLLMAKDPAPSVAAMAQSGILQAVMKGADPKALAPLIHLEREQTPDWRRRSAVLGGGELRDAWRLSKKDAQHLADLRVALETMEPLCAIAYRGGAALATNAGLARAAIFETPPPANMRDDIELGANAIFPVKAQDLPDLRGAALGARLRELESTWIRSNFSLSKDHLLTL